jgi:heterodisulfide reductase subunit C
MATNWGYSIHKDRQIDLDVNDVRVFRKVLAAEPTLNQCISCGTCASTCSAANFTQFSLRKIILNVKRGETAGLADEVAKCMLCGKCQLACPRNVNTRNIVLQVQKALEHYARN